MVPQKVSNQKKLYLEALRIIACFHVIYNHTDGFHLYLNGDGDIKTFLAYCYSACTKMSVPIFFMISGSLLLTSEKSKKKKIVQLLVIILISNLMIYIKYNFHKTLNIVDFIESMFAGNNFIGYWYLYAYLAVLIMLPFLRDIAKQLNKQKFRYLLILHFLLCTIVPICKYILKNFDINFKLNESFDVPFAINSSIFYMLIGFYIDNKIDVLKKLDFVKLGLATILGIIISAFFTCHQGIKYEFSQDFFQCVDYMIAIFVFLFVKKILNSQTERRIHSVIYSVGNLTFGIYLIEPFF